MLLNDALDKVVGDLNHWAYTQTIVERDGKGRLINETVLRVDPSKPYSELYTPLNIDGRAPTAGEIRKFQRQGERVGQELAKAEKEGAEPVRMTLGELMDLGRAFVVSEDATGISYEVPLKKENNTRFPPEKFRVTVRVSKASHAFEHIDVQLRAALRAALVVKIKSGEGRLNFATVDPKFAPTITMIHGGGAGTIAFVPIGRSYDLTRQDFKRVKPYADRFGVKIGPLKAIDF